MPNHIRQCGRGCFPASVYNLTLNPVRYRSHLTFMKPLSTYLMAACWPRAICLFVFLLNQIVCPWVVKGAVGIHFRSKCSLNANFECDMVCVCGGGRGGVLIYTCILGSLDELGGVPHNTAVEDKPILWLCVAIITIITRRTKVLAALHRVLPMLTVSNPRMTRPSGCVVFKVFIGTSKLACYSFWVVCFLLW